MRTRQHVNPLGLAFEEFRGKRPALPDDRPVEVEIGCADAQFLFERAAADPSRSYVGFEVRELLVSQVNQRARDEGLPVHGVFCNANIHMTSVIPAGRVDRVYVNFPDPWFKSRHRKRRMVDDALAEGIAAICRPGADLLFQSDVWSVAIDAMEIFERHDHWFANQVEPWTFWKEGNPYGVRSWREQHCEAAGMKIWRIRYRRRA